MLIHTNSASIPLFAQSVHCVVTSPPYWGLRDYGLPPTEWPTVTYTPMAGLAPVTVQGCEPGCQHEWVSNSRMLHTGSSASAKEQSNTGAFHGDQTTDDHYCQLCGGWRGCVGLEPTPEMFVAHIVAVFREVWRVLRDDGTCWLNFGDSYNAARDGGWPGGKKQWKPEQQKHQSRSGVNAPGLKPKDLCGIPWRVAFALQADGWYLRNDIIWHKPNPMPESVTDRCTKSHEYLFLLSKRQRYFYDAEAVRERALQPIGESRRTGQCTARMAQKVATQGQRVNSASSTSILGSNQGSAGRNRRTVWTIPTRGYSGAHFATFPPALVTPCVLAGTSTKGVCPQCGKPWVRVVEKTGGSIGTSWHDHSTDAESGMSQIKPRVGSAIDSEGKPYTVTTLGWRPGCDHAFEPVPAIVLDPFCGSGTVGAVCKPHGRKFVGLDLSSNYLRELALPRAENKCTMESITELPMFADL